MIIKRTWNTKLLGKNIFGNLYKYEWTGYFLLGFIPVYIIRKTIW